MKRRGPIAAAGIAAAAIMLTLAACTHDDPPPSPSPSVTPSATASPSVTPSPRVTPSETPSPTPIAQGPATITAASGWKTGSEKDRDAAAADPNVTAVVGVWTDPAGADISVVETANASGNVDAEVYFQDSFGTLGPGDGVEVTHSVTTTDAGQPLLLVGITPAGGLGGDAEAMFYVLTPTSIVSGVATTFADDFTSTMEDMAKAGRSVSFE